MTTYCEDYYYRRYTTREAAEDIARRSTGDTGSCHYGALVAVWRTERTPRRMSEEPLRPSAADGDEPVSWFRFGKEYTRQEVINYFRDTAPASADLAEVLRGSRYPSLAGR